MCGTLWTLLIVVKWPILQFCWRKVLRSCTAFSTQGRFTLLKDKRGVRVREASNPGPIRQLAHSPLLTRRSDKLQAMESTAGHRRGLVVEVAVALPGPPHVITDIMESDASV